MKVLHLLALVGFATLSWGQASPTLRPDPPHVCSDCDEWNRPQQGFRIYGNTYYVGTAGLSALLITSDKGHILLDGALTQSAALIDANIRQLGFQTTDIRLIVNSHAHFDHAGAIAALQRVSGATVAASAQGARALQQGGATPDDPQYGFGRAPNAIPPVAKVQVVADGEVLRVGGLALKAHLTPGHTPGSTTWAWQSCEGPRCVNVVYADSLNAVSAPKFRFTGDGTAPNIVDSFRNSINKVASLPCDIIVSVHPSFTEIDAKLKRRAQQPDGPNPFIDAQGQGCRAYAAGAMKRLEARLATER